ncbi:MAG TPA: winged helix-turn-helix domain-containing protein [Burkholderiaceae bacterium]|nr:winged helix-turn-helix domain-containing protein [Burkholderiaceae bacterium]
MTVEPRVMQVLVVLAKARGEVVGRDELIEHCWSGRVVGDSAINRVVYRIRQLAATLGNGSFEVETVPRVGYRLSVAVAAHGRIAAAGDPGQDDDPASNEPETRPEPEVAPSAPIRRRRWLHLAFGTCTAAGLAATGWWALRRPVAAPAPIQGATLAVLPFRALTEDGRDKLLEIGMADSLIARLSGVPGLVVRSTASALRFAAPEQDPLLAAQELDVDWIVDGSLQRSGDRLRATARLLRRADGVAVWSGSFDEAFTGVFELQDQISQRVTQALAPVLRTELVAVPQRHGELGRTRNAQAYQLYLAAMWRAQGQRAEDIALALRLLEEALALDPSYALAWVGLAWTHRRRLWIDAEPSSVFTPADAALAHALELAPALANARAERGYGAYWYGYDWQAAEREFRAALAANANVAAAHFGLAQLLLTQDRIDEGMRHMRLTRELDPLSPVFNAIEASFLLDLGRLAEAESRLQRALDIAPRLWLSHVVQGMLLVASKQFDEGLAALRTAADLGGDISRPQAVLGVRLAAMGRQDEARETLAHVQARARTRFVPPTSLAALHAALGEVDAALTELERADSVRDTRLIYLKDDPHWRELRTQPRFVALMKKLGLDRFGHGLSPV